MPRSPKLDANEERRRSLELAVSQIEKAHGKGSIMRLGSQGFMKLPVIPTRRIALDLVTGIGGFPKGRIVEIYGPESSGKTTVALHAVASAQQDGGSAAFVDAEHALDPVYAKKLGVNTEELLVSQPDSGEQALEITEVLVRSGAVDIVVVDSVAALVPRAELEGEMGDSHVGLQARLMSQALRKLTAAINRSNTCVVFINQVREKIGISYGSNETTTGGRALKFYASMRIDIRKGFAIKDTAGNTYGHKCKIKVVKNKLAPPFKQVECEMLFGEGLSREALAIDLGIEAKVVARTGSWFSYGDVRLGQGKDNSRATLRENPDLIAEIEAKIIEALAPDDLKDRLQESMASVPEPIIDEETEALDANAEEEAKAK